jgi:hypothetical protein
MSARKKILLYGLSSQHKFSQNIAEKVLYEKGFVLNERNKNCLFPHNKKETLKHWITKAIIFQILRNKGRNVGTEVEVGNGIVDVFDSDNRIAYEIENNFSKSKIQKKIHNLTGTKDVFFINLNRIPNEINVAKKYLERIVV